MLESTEAEETEVERRHDGCIGAPESSFAVECAGELRRRRDDDEPRQSGDASIPPNAQSLHHARIDFGVRRRSRPSSGG